MTTFTMQDLTETPEEKEAMDAILNNMAIPSVGTDPTELNTDTIIQGATGAQYQVIDFKQFEGQMGEGKTNTITPPTAKQAA